MSLISIDELKTLVEQPDDLCVSLYMPTISAGAEVLQNPIRFKNLIKEAQNKLDELDIRHTEVLDFLEPAREIDQNDFWQHQNQGLAIFVAKDFLRYYRVPLDFEELVVVSDRFHLKPLLPLLTDDGKFYILTLSQKQIRFLEATRYSVREVEVEEIPNSLEEALLDDPTAKEGQFHIQTSKGGTSNPAPQAGSYPGQGSPDRDEHQKNILQFFHVVNNALHKYLSNQRAPLILVGVEYLMPIYREANTYQNLLEEGITENAQILKPEEIHAQALPIIEPYFLKAREDAISRYWELTNTGKTSTDLEETVSGAYYGRVDELFVAIGVQKWGNFDVEKNELHLHSEQEPKDVDLLNSAAIQTLLNGGSVYAVQPDEVPDNALVAAVFRY